MNVYLFFTLIFDIERSRSYSLQSNLDTIATIFTTRVAVKALLTIFEARPKTRDLLAEFTGCPPEAASGVYKRSTFWWLNDLLKRGYSASFTLDDLFHLDKHLQSDLLHRTIGSAWESCKFPRFLPLPLQALNWHIVTHRNPHSLFYATLRKLKWPILAVVPPRLCLIGFNFCQPFLINRAVSFSQEGDTSQTTNIGYGLIGAYVIVFVGIAVSGSRNTTDTTPLILCEGIDGPIYASDIQVHYHDARWSCIHAL